MAGEETVDRGEPTAREAADLIDYMMGAGTVGRLDALQAALRSAYIRGRTDVREEAQELCDQAAARFAAEARRLAEEHAAAFVESVSARTREDLCRDALPWTERLRAV